MKTKRLNYEVWQPQKGFIHEAELGYPIGEIEARRCAVNNEEDRVIDIIDAKKYGQYYEV